MNSLSRPPHALIVAILRDASLLPALTRRKLWACMRKRLADTPYRFPNTQELWSAYRQAISDQELSSDPLLERTLRVKDVRTDSGVAPITVLTKPYPCPGQCVYCPTETRMPKSYISSEPAAARALSLAFDPYEQVVQRVEALERNGHDAQKIELIIKGGTWSAYRWEYRRWFITRCFQAANDLSSLLSAHSTPESRPIFTEEQTLEDTDLADAQHRNESATYRIIGLTIETRPDWVNASEILRLRQLGCTRVELGVQTLQDEVLALTKRGHTVHDAIRATALLKYAGFKTDFHVLPGQPGSTPERDLADFSRLFSDPSFRPDMIKLYPCVVLPTAELHAWAERGSFVPLQGDTLKELLIQMQTLVPRYCRISRLIRDFPEKDISYGNKITNLRESLESEMKRRGISCQCLRCREVGHVKDIDPSTVTTQLFEEWYDNAGGREVFITIEDPERRAVFAFLRLRLPSSSETIRAIPSLAEDAAFQRAIASLDEAFPLLRDSAFVRELHTYGTALNLTQTRSDAAQHKGYGRMLIQHAERIAAREGYPRLAVISGIGVRAYYAQLGYSEHETYMVKELHA